MFSARSRAIIFEGKFLTASDLPPNLLRVQLGEALRHVGDDLRRVVRVGYRKTAADYKQEANNLLASDKGYDIARRLQNLVGGPTRGLGHVIARALCQKDMCGGPERGIWVEPTFAIPGRKIIVESTRCVRLGTYYPPSGGGEDYEDGGLRDPKTIVLIQTTDGFEYISGDLMRIPVTENLAK